MVKAPGRYVTLEEIEFMPTGGGSELWIATGHPKHSNDPMIQIKHLVRPLPEGLEITELIDINGGWTRWVNRVEWRDWGQFKVPWG